MRSGRIRECREEYGRIFNQDRHFPLQGNTMDMIKKNVQREGIFLARAQRPTGNVAKKRNMCYTEEKKKIAGPCVAIN